MLMPDELGDPRLIDRRISEALKPPFRRTELVTALLDRMVCATERLENRMGQLPDAEWFRQRLIGLNDETLSVLVESDAWITKAVGGLEVSVDEAFPTKISSFASLGKQGERPNY